MREAKPVIGELTGPVQMKFVQGASRIELGHLAGRMQRHTAYSRFYDWPVSTQAMQWIVQMPADQPFDVVIRAGCPRAGSVAATMHVDGRAEVKTTGRTIGNNKP